MIPCDKISDVSVLPSIRKGTIYLRRAVFLNWTSTPWVV